MNNKFLIFANLLYSLCGWFILLYTYWFIFIEQNPYGYYLNPYKHNEFYLEFVLVNIIFMFILLSIIFLLIKWRIERKK